LTDLDLPSDVKQFVIATDLDSERDSPLMKLDQSVWELSSPKLLASLLITDAKIAVNKVLKPTKPD